MNQIQDLEYNYIQFLSEYHLGDDLCRQQAAYFEHALIQMNKWLKFLLIFFSFILWKFPNTSNNQKGKEISQSQPFFAKRNSPEFFAKSAKVDVLWEPKIKDKEASVGRGRETLD